ncbi:MAG TPA: hypothetical protein VIY56_04800 [Vicinamibacterales bacterium]
MRLMSRLVSVSAVATCWLVVLTAQLPAQQAPDPVRAAFRALGASHVRSLRFTGFGATYAVGQPQWPQQRWARVPLPDYVADVDYAAPAMRVQPPGATDPLQQVWVTPHGFLKAASANRATTRTVPLGTEVSFSVDGHRYVGILDRQNRVERVHTWVGGPQPGAGLVETFYRDYERHGAVMFPRHITQYQGGFPVLDLWVAAVDVNRPFEPARAAGQ